MTTDAPSALLITAADSAATYRPSLDRLLDSLQSQPVPCDVVLALRGDDDVPASSGHVRLHIVRLARPASLTRSRNAALAHAQATGLAIRAAVVGFPDDDCWYDATTLTSALRELDDTDVVCGAYAPSPELLDARRFPDLQRPLSVGRILKSASSVTMFLTPQALADIGSFDERLGVAALWGSSEDVDYLLRARRRGLRMRYVGPRILVGHDYKPGNPSAYYPGNVAVLAKHARDLGIAMLLLRRLLGGLVLVATRRMPLSVYLKGLRALGMLVSTSSD